MCVCECVCAYVRSANLSEVKRAKVGSKSSTCVYIQHLCVGLIRLGMIFRSVITLRYTIEMIRLPPGLMRGQTGSSCRSDLFSVVGKELLSLID